MKKILLAMLLLLTAIGLRAEVTVTFTDPTPETVLEALPQTMKFSLSEAMNGLSPDVIIKSGDAECTIDNYLVMRDNNSYQHFYFWPSYYVTDQVKAAIASTYEFSVTVKLNDGTLCDPVTFHMKKPITVTFTNPTPETVMDALPQMMYFSLSEAMNGLSPDLTIKSGDAECKIENGYVMRNGNSYKDFYFFPYYFTNEVKEAIASTYEFTVTVTLNDGTVCEPVTFHMKKPITVAFTNPTPETVMDALPQMMYFSLSEAMNGLSPELLIKSGDAECKIENGYVMRNGNSYKDFYFFPYYFTDDVKAAIASTYEFSVTVTLNDGTVCEPVTFHMKKPEPAITATFTDPKPDTELEALPTVFKFSLSEKMNGLSPTALIKSGDVEETIPDGYVMRMDATYQNFAIYPYYFSEDLKAAIAENYELTITLTLNDGTVCEPVTFHLKKPVVPTAEFAKPAGSIFAGLPSRVDFSLTPALSSDAPKLLLNDDIELTATRNGDSDTDFYASLDAVSSAADIIAAGEFTLTPVMADGTKLDAIKYYVVPATFGWTPAASNKPGTTYGALPPTMTFTLSQELPAEGLYTTGLLKAAGLPETFEGWEEEVACTIEGTTVTFDMNSISAEGVAVIREAGAFTIGLALANTELGASYKVEVRLQTVTLGYCPDDFVAGGQSLGTNGAASTVGAAIKIPAAKLEGLKGCEIKKIRIGIGEGLERVYGWIRPALNKPVHVMTKLEDTSEGWHEIEFETPYVITGDEIYVGYSGYQPQGVKAIRTGGSDRPDACYLGVKDSWEDLSNRGYGALYIQAFTEAVLPNCDLGVDNVRLDKQYYKDDETAVVDFIVFNAGANAVGAYKVTWQIDEGEPYVSNVPRGLSSDERSTFRFNVPLTGVAEGIHKLTVACELADGGMADEVAGNDAIVLDLPVYTQSFPRTVLLENFTTLLCNNCPNGHKCIENAIAGRDDVAWVAHHVGFGTDEFTISESDVYLDFDVVGAPSIMLDRTTFEGSTPPFTIGYTNTEYGGNLIKGHIDNLAAVPAFASVAIDNTYDEGTRKLSMTITGKKNAIFDLLFPENNYTIFLTESDIFTTTPQAGASGLYLHNHVLRAVLTPEFGTPVEWDDDSYTVTAEYTIPEAWKPWNMEIVAFLNKPFDAENLSNAQVLNTAFAKVNAVNSLKGIAAEGAMQIVNGEIVVEGAASVEVFSADGLRLSNKALQPGIYLVRATDAAGNAVVMKSYIK